MSEKEMFMNAWEREFGTTLKILKQLPAEKAGFRPTPDKTRSAQELAAVFISEMGVIDGVVKGKIQFGSPSPKFGSYQEVLKAYEEMHKSMVPKVKGMSEADWNAKISVPVGPGKMGEVRRGDMCWLMLNDSVHHRGQFSIYLRMVGAKVPSIYGPSADEPWM